ncbi:hypothetical protein ATANTOWER_023189 [Ataeniobius toweri]|uniref:Uncharacterized protein n=1 Tax=Ataeniobius toweri TaxID=208326 RepID=A0ABU7CC66_9TELE|nr:hypothetical protein [Ataeniobius toweri]
MKGLMQNAKPLTNLFICVLTLICGHDIWSMVKSMSFMNKAEVQSSIWIGPQTDIIIGFDWLSEAPNPSLHPTALNSSSLATKVTITKNSYHKTKILFFCVNPPRL